MTDIKTKDNIKKDIKSIDRKVIFNQKRKDSIINIKQKIEDMTTHEETNQEEYETQKLTNLSKNSISGTNRIKKNGNKSLGTTKENISKAKDSVKKIKTKVVNIKNTRKTKKSLQNAKKTKQMINKSIKETKKTSARAKEAAKRTYQGIKLTVKATIKAIKLLITGTKALITAIVAGGWIAVLIIIIVCFIGLLCSSTFGIFFSNENTINNNITISSIVKELNNEVATRISEIQNSNIYDDYIIESNRASWKDVLAIYTIKVSNGENSTDVITIDENKKKILKETFWDINSISSEVITEFEETPETLETTEKSILYIKIDSKTIDEITRQYNFSQLQLEALNELLDEEYSSLWSAAIYGTSLGSPNLVKIALEQVGNVGGEIYWSWYGFQSRVEWCAVFVSWVANEAGYIDSKIIPKFAVVQNGIQYRI